MGTYDDGELSDEWETPSALEEVDSNWAKYPKIRKAGHYYTILGGADPHVHLERYAQDHSHCA